MSKFQLHTQAKFFETLNRDILATQHGDRIALATMSFEPSEPPVQATVKNLGEAALRGVDVCFAVEAYALLEPSSIGPAVFRSLPWNNSTSQRRLDSINQLSEVYGVQTKIVNLPDKPITNLYAGRSHLKINVVGNKVYLGGPSFQGTDRIDTVVGFEDLETANMLFEITKRLVSTGETKAALGDNDKTYFIDQDTQILIDAGIKNQSIIFEEAIKLIDGADEVLIFGSQYFPDSKIIKHIKAAYERGVKTTILYNHPSQHDHFKILHSAIIATKKWRNPEEFFQNQSSKNLPKFHAKILANEKTVMIGSHNYIEAGVKLGTAEIALLRHDDILANLAFKKVLEQTNLSI